MGDAGIDYLQHVGRVAFPRAPRALTGTANCPACFSPLTGVVCGKCSLDLAHPAASELYGTSVDAARLLERRLEIIGRIRYESARADATESAPRDSALRTLEETREAKRSPSDAPPPSTAPPTAAIDAASPARPPWRSSVQLILLLVGVSLLSIAAIFFLVYAFLTFGLIWRAVIIGAITVAAVAASSVLRRRALTATAEGVAAFGVVLVYLDAFAFRANDLFDLGSTDPAVYWGAAVVAASVAFLGWRRMSGLRVPSIVGFATFAPGVGLLVAGATSDLESAARIFAVFSTIAAAGLIHLAAPLLSPRPLTMERALVLTTTGAALLVAAAAALTIEPESDWAPSLAIAGLASLAMLHAVALVQLRHKGGSERAYARVFSGFTGVLATGAVAVSATRTESEEFLVFVPLCSAAAVALLAEAVARAVRPGFTQRCATIAAWSAAAVTAATLVVPVVVAALTAIPTALVALASPWRLNEIENLAILGGTPAWALLAIATSALLAAVSWLVQGVARRRAPLLVWVATLTATLGVALLHTVWAMVAAWLVLAALALGVLLVRPAFASSPALRAPFVGVIATAGTLGYATGWATTSTWGGASIVVIGLLIAARPLAPSAGRAAMLGASIVVLLIGAAASARLLTFGDAVAPEIESINAARFAGLAATVVLALAAVSFRGTEPFRGAGPSRGFGGFRGAGTVRGPGAFLSPVSTADRPVSTADRRVSFWIAAAVAGAAAWDVSARLPSLERDVRDAVILPEYSAGLIASLMLLVALTMWAALRATVDARFERAAASVALAPVLFLVVTALARALDAPQLGGSVAAATAALLAGAGSLTVALERPSAVPRHARELGVAFVGATAVLSAVSTDTPAAWLVLVLAGLTVLFLSISADGLFSSASPRRHLGWLALALAIAGLWWRLAGEEVSALEPYVLPLAGALLGVAILIHRSAERRTGASDGRAAPLIALGGLLLAILPLSVNAATGSPVRAVVVFAVSGVLLLGGSYVVASPRLRAFCDATALAGAIGVLATSIGRAVQLIDTPGGTADARLDAWLAAAFLVLLLAAVGQTRRRNDGSDRVRGLAGQGLGILALALMLAFELPVLRIDSLGASRGLALVLVFAAVHVGTFLIDRAPFTRAVGWAAAAFGGIAAAVGISVGAIEPIELATVPLAGALLVTGILHLDALPNARSWPWLGPGTVILLVPPLVATIDDRPLWRLVGLGIVGVAVVVIAVTRCLQAPFVIGVAVVLVHGIATFLPQLRAAYESVPWWLWLGAGGVLLILLAARYERRIRDVRSAVTRLGALR